MPFFLSSCIDAAHLVEFPDDEPTFKELVQEYLFSPEGRHHLQDLKVEGSILDLEGNFNITVELVFLISNSISTRLTLFDIICRQGSRARFHHLSLKNASAKNKALESIAALSNDIVFGDDVDLSSPIIFTHSYIEWEANRVRFILAIKEFDWIKSEPIKMKLWILVVCAGD